MPTPRPAATPAPNTAEPSIVVRTSGRATKAQRSALLTHIQASCENRPGTYRMLAEGGRVIYVGKSRALRTRLLSYFRAKGRRNKSARILRHAFGLEWSYAPNEFGALLDELRLIKQLRPHFNSAMVSDEWPRAYVALTRGPVPGLRVVRRTDDAQAEGLWGPFRRVHDLRDAVHTLAEITGVRDCAIDDAQAVQSPRTLWFADQMPTRRSNRSRTPGCLRAEVGSCPGPCIGGGSLDMYAAGVQLVRAFLDARDDTPLREARARMLAASGDMQFERAAVWRDKAQRLDWLFGRVSRFQASMDRLTFRYNARDSFGDGGRVYLVRRGTVRADVPTPVCDADERALALLSERIFHGADPKGVDVPMYDLDEFYLVASWFRRHPEELAHTATV